MPFSLLDPPLHAIGVLILGLIVGSFLTVVAARLPAMLQRRWAADCAQLGDAPSPPDPSAPTHRFDLAYPPSHCPRCAAPLRWWHNLPLLSFAILRGRCGHCSHPIAWRYPLIEATSGALSVIVYMQLGSAQGLWGLPLLWGLIALSTIDLEHQLLPDSLTLGLLWAGLLLATQSVFAAPADAIIGAAAGFGSLWLIAAAFRHVTGRDGMGRGDFKLFAALGAWLGWSALPLVLLLASLSGAAVGIARLLISGQRAALPFGPHLAGAGLLALLYGDALIDGYWNWALGH